jgi:ligand-binding SRPBCC domain-containing protein
MTAAHIALIANDDQLRKRLAKFVASQCFRNTVLEDLHAGVSPDSKTGDYTDVKVISPYGEIPWLQLSRLSDEEMKTLMIDVVNRTYTWLTRLFSGEAASVIIEGLRQKDPLPRWNEPEYLRD